jgi:hypothetical protein
VHVLGKRRKLSSVVVPALLVLAAAKTATAYGKQIEVLPPWTPIRYSADTLQVWGRKYEFGGSIFPKQIASRGTLLLAGPITLRCKTASERVATRLNKVGTVLLSPGELKLRQNFQFGTGLHASVNLDAEYDGVLSYQITVHRRPGIAIRDLSLDIPLRAAVAAYFQKYILMNQDWGEQATHSVPPGRGVVWQSMFNPYVWLGNENEGLFWFSQSSEGWRTVSDPLRLIRSRGRVNFVVSFINTPTLVPRDLRFQFGLQGTPTRALPSRWRSIGIVSTWPARNGLSLAAFARNPRPAIVILWPNPKEWCWFGFPEPRNPARMEALIHSFHSRGIKVVAYVQAEALASNMPAYKTNIEAWQYLPAVVDKFSSDVLAMGAPIHAVNPASGWGEFFLNHLQKFLGTYDVDGLYLDNIYLYPDENRMQYGAGTIYPVLALRAHLRSIYAMVKRKNERDLVIVHMSGHDLTPAISYSDVILDGEHVASRAWTCQSYRTMLNLKEFQGEFAGRQWGPTPMFLSTLGYKKGCLASYRPSEYVLSYALVHGDRLWGEFKDDILGRVYQVYKEFGISDARFVPYWNASNDVAISTGDSTNARDVKVSLYVKGEQGRAQSALLVVSNLNPSAISAEISPRLQRLGMRNAQEATIYSFDAETHELHERIQNDNLHLSVPGYCFSLVWVQ